MQRKRSIAFEEAHPLGIGRLTACVKSTSARPGLLIGSTSGLFHLEDKDSRPQKIRRYPVDFMLSGEMGVMCYEEAGGQGRFAVLDGGFEERKTDSGLARRINPKALWKDGLIVHHRGDFYYLDVETEEREPIAGFVPTRTIGPFARTDEGFEFTAVLQGPGWLTCLYQLDLSGESGSSREIRKLAQAEDPIFARHFLPLPNGDYLVALQGQAIFHIFKVFPGKNPGFRTWSLVPIVGDTHPVGLVLQDDRLVAACADSLLAFKLSDEFLAAG